MKNAFLHTDDLIGIEFTYSPRDVDFARSLEGRRWNPNEKIWTANLNKQNVEACINNGFSLSNGLCSWYQATQRPPEPEKPVEVAGLKEPLFPFQSTGVGFLERHNGRALLADEMGLGKTVQALAWLQLRSDALPAVVVCPASVKLVWERETKRFTMLKPFVLSSLSGETPCGYDIYIVNYDVFGAYTSFFTARGVKAIVIDECHYIKSKVTRRTKLVSAFAKTCTHVLALSGTPIVNRPAEMFQAISLVNPKLFPSWWKYAMRYCNARHNGYGWDFSGASNTLELHDQLIRTIMIRRTKADVLPDLPEKIRSVVPLEGEGDLQEYKSAESNLIEWLRQNAPEKISGMLRCEALAKVEILKQLAVKAKFDQACEWLDTWLETDGKLVVFTTHRETVRLLMEKYGQIAVKLEGGDSMEERQKAVDSFQTDNAIRLFIGNIQAAGVGLTLTAASNVCFFELGWTPGAHIQAEDRVHRIGQQADSVGIHYLVASGTIEENILGLLDKKRKVTNAVLNGGDVSENDDELLIELLNKMRDKEIK